MKRAVLILGGGTMQMPAIREARDLDLEVHMADGNARCRGVTSVDHFYHIDLRDRDALLEQARTIGNLNAVFTAGTDFSASVAWISEALGLPGIPFETSLDATDKGRMRARLAAAGVRVPRFRVIESALTVSEEASVLEEIVAEFGLPLVCKPVDSMGARGVRRADDRASLVDAVSAARTISRSGRVIIEERIGGSEFSLDAIVFHGKIIITGIAERHIYFEPWFVELGHTIPATLDEADRGALEETFRAGIRALGIDHGAAKGDIFLTTDDKGRPEGVVGEIAARLSGGFMSGWTYPASSGVRLTRLGLRVALGEALATEEFRPRWSRIAVERALISAPGCIEGISIPDARPDGVEELFVHRAAGDVVAPPTNNVEKVANVIACADTRDEAERTAIEFLEKIDVRLRPGDPSTDAFLFGTSQGPYARYRWKDRDAAGMETSAYYGDLSRISARVRRGAPLPVRVSAGPERPWGEDLIRLQPVGEAAAVLASLSASGTIEPSRGDDALGTVFWRAFVAAGRQGVVYLRDLLVEGLFDSIAEKGRRR